jgi:hypothetical protein
MTRQPLTIGERDQLEILEAALDSADAVPLGRLPVEASRRRPAVAELIRHGLLNESEGAVSATEAARLLDGLSEL